MRTVQNVSQDHISKCNLFSFLNVNFKHLNPTQFLNHFMF